MSTGQTKSKNIHGLALIKRETAKQENGQTVQGTLYYIYNGHGDVTEAVDINNNVLNSYEYDAYGKIVEETETFENPYRYAGYYYDTETQL